MKNPNSSIKEVCPICNTEVVTLLHWWLNGLYITIKSCKEQHVQIATNLPIKPNDKPKIITPN